MTHETPQAAAPRLPPLAILVVIAGLGPTSLNIFLPSMPGMMRVYDTGYDTVQLTLTFYLVGLAAAQLVYGPLSDRIGRRPALLIGLVLYVIGSVACVAAPTIEKLIAGRVLQAVGGCSGIVMSRAIIRDVYERGRAASILAYVTMAMVVAPLMAPTVGGFLDDWFGWRAGFVLMVVVGVLTLAACFLLLHETHTPSRETAPHREVMSGALELLGQRRFHGYAFQVAFNSGVFYSFIAGAPYVMIELLNRTASEYGIWFAVASSVYMGGNFIAARISERVGSDRMITIGTTISLIGVFTLGAFYLNGLVLPVTLFGCMSIVAFGNGMGIPNGILGAVSVDPARAGTASGLSGFSQMAVGAGLSYSVGFLLSDTAGPLVAMMIISSVSARCFFEWGVRRG
ncbi:MAG: multidrug transporter [Alphaproteobacteria bacterium]|nr:multidrug transporter [Alphaproteobacteria bacterium]|tara:strand:- start:549 stop:1745 length:1197 start_codon:yes stop_codon:yes gene_type:complete